VKRVTGTVTDALKVGKHERSSNTSARFSDPSHLHVFNLQKRLSRKFEMADEEDIAALVVDNGSGMCKGAFSWRHGLYRGLQLKCL
jgi:hypothetical protein